MLQPVSTTDHMLQDINDVIKHDVNIHKNLSVAHILLNM